jgi:Ca-activated chloride channel family protein
MVNGERRTFEFPASLKGKEAGNDFIPRLWATRRIGFLLDEIRLRGGNAELREEVTDLARRFGIVTPYTSYLIVEDEARRGVPMSSQTLPQLQNNAAERNRAQQSWSDLNRKSDGLAGVANARSAQALRASENVSFSVDLAKSEAQRSLSAASPATATLSIITKMPTPAATPTPQESAAQFVGGRSFYRNGAQWIDAEVQQQAQARRVQLKFGSPEYFSFLTANSEARPWLALGQQVQFVFQGSVYEVSE